MKDSGKRLRLVTIPISHFCEKARWALDRASLDYAEEGHLQALHRRASLAAGGTGQVPVLVTGDGHAVPDSTAILRWVDERLPESRRLYPDGALGVEVAELAAHLDEPFGSDTRLWAYHWFLPDPRLAVGNLMRTRTIPLAQRAIVPLVLPLISLFVRRRYSIDSQSARAAEQRFVAVLDEVAERISDGRPFLLGDRLSAADVTFAALSSPISLPPEYGSPIATLDDLPPRARRRMEPLHGHPACEFARGLYRRERGVRR
ncbi:MAG: glutathione S-transferase [Acidobacteria bacterium]|nr:MAG: glutathione S-transferase [Acidobacteriota bacterium]